MLSGASSLVYQVAWQRILALHSGVGIYSVAAIVALFMLGLGVGSLAGGSLSVRLAPRASVQAFAAVELAVGLFGASSGWLYYDVLYVRAVHLYAPLWRAILLHALALGPPTFLMGLSLPLLVRGLLTDVERAGRIVGLLYGFNLLGASAGALAAPWVLIRFAGIPGALHVAALGNVLAGLLGLAAGARAPSPPPAGPGGATAMPRHTPGRVLWPALYALSGLCALSLEIVWFRVLDVALKSNAFTFGTVLCVYLAGSAAGCLAAALFADRVARPLPLFLGAQCALILYAGLVVVLLGWLPAGTPVLSRFDAYWTGGTTFRLDLRYWKMILELYGAMPILLFGPPTVLMGASFPLLQRAVHDDPATAGRKVGLLQAANIAGCVAGSLLAGLVTLRSIGTTGTLRALMGVGVVFALLGARAGSRRMFVSAAAGLAAVALALPGQGRLWMRLHGRPEAAGIVNEDATGVAALITLPDGRTRGVFVNGKQHSSIPYGGMHTRLGAAPAIIHPAPRTVAIVGLGSGDTAWAAACRPETRGVTVFEISGGQPGLLARLAAEPGQAVLASFLADPRLRIVIEDGRRALQSAEARYDVIEADALWPSVAYSGNLYSVEFFSMCVRRLAPGGVLCTWAPTPRVYASFVTAVPYVIGLGDHEVLIGSNQPLDVDGEAWAARLGSAPVRAYLGEEAAASVQWMLDRLRPLHRTSRRQPEHERNRDLFPRDEFASP